MKMLEFPFSDSSSGEFSLLAPVLTVLVEEVHARKSEYNKGFHNTTSSSCLSCSATSFSRFRWLVQILQLNDILNYRRQSCTRCRHFFFNIFHDLQNETKTKEDKISIKTKKNIQFIISLWAGKIEFLLKVFDDNKSLINEATSNYRVSETTFYSLLHIVLVEYRESIFIAQRVMKQHTGSSIVLRTFSTSTFLFIISEQYLRIPRYFNSLFIYVINYIQTFLNHSS